MTPSFLQTEKLTEERLLGKSYLKIVLQLLGAPLIVVRVFVRAAAFTTFGGHLDSGHVICSHVHQGPTVWNFIGALVAIQRWTVSESLEHVRLS